MRDCVKPLMGKKNRIGRDGRVVDCGGLVRSESDGIAIVRLWRDCVKPLMGKKTE